MSTKQKPHWDKFYNETIMFVLKSKIQKLWNTQQCIINTVNKNYKLYNKNKLYNNCNLNI